MKLRVPLLAVLLLGAVATLAPLAYATPPDPTWIAGVWDDGDHDDVIFRITSDGAIAPQLASHARPVHAVVDDLPQTNERPGHAQARSSPPPRAPPVS